MNKKTETQTQESEAKKAASKIKESFANTKQSLDQIKSETEADLERKSKILNQFIEESDKFKAKKEKQLDLMKDRLMSATQSNDPNALFAEMDKLTDLMNSYSDDEIVQAVKDRQLKDARIQD